MSFRAKRRISSTSSGVTEILRYALDDKMIERFYFDFTHLFIYEPNQKPLHDLPETSERLHP